MGIDRAVWGKHGSAQSTLPGLLCLYKGLIHICIYVYICICAHGFPCIVQISGFRLDARDAFVVCKPKKEDVDCS